MQTAEGTASEPGEDNAQQALIAAGVGIWSWDRSTDSLTLSPLAATLLGQAPVSQLNFPAFIDLIHPDDRPAAAAFLRDGAAPFDIDIRTCAAPPKRLRLRGGLAGEPHLSNRVHGILIDAPVHPSTQEANLRLAAIVTSSDDATLTQHR